VLNPPLQAAEAAEAPREIEKHHIDAKRGKHREAVALLLTAYRFAPDRKKTLEVYVRQAETEDDPQVRAMLAESVTRLSKTP
jgi:cytochrome c-type biogenesis protein CcmH/NrfG